MTWQMAMACHALTNWATESPGNSVAEFEYLRLSWQGSSRSRYQAGMPHGEGVASVKHKAEAQILDMLQIWQSGLSLYKSEEEREIKKGKESDSGKNNPTTCSAMQFQKWSRCLVMHTGKTGGWLNLGWVTRTTDGHMPQSTAVTIIMWNHSSVQFTKVVTL